MGIICVVLAVASLIMCLISLIWNSTVVVEHNDSGERGHALFHLLKTFVVVPTVVLMLFVFSAHLRCNDKDNTWEVKNHGCQKCQECPKPPLKPEAER
jgi:uncharacterized membrane protein